MLIITVVSVYVFKSFKVTAITVVILGVCVEWFGLMSLFNSPEFHDSPVFWVYSYNHLGDRDSYGGSGTISSTSPPKTRCLPSNSQCDGWRDPVLSARPLLLWDSGH